MIESMTQSWKIIPLCLSFHVAAVRAWQKTLHVEILVRLTPGWWKYIHYFEATCRAGFCLIDGSRDPCT